MVIKISIDVSDFLSAALLSGSEANLHPQKLISWNVLVSIWSGSSLLRQMCGTCCWEIAFWLDLVASNQVFRNINSFIIVTRYYRPQTKFATFMFLQVSVILSTGGGGVA